MLMLYIMDKNVFKQSLSCYSNYLISDSLITTWILEHLSGGH